MSIMIGNLSSRAAFGRRGLCCALALIFAGLGSAASGREPTANEQWMLEMINRMRTRPQQELDLLANIHHGVTPTFASPRSDDPNVAAALTFYNVRPDILVNQWASLTPVQPLAWNLQLGDSSATYSQVMIAEDRQGHDLDEHGNDLAARLIASDYLFVGGGTAAENVFAFTRSVFHGHAAFAIDYGQTATGIQSPPGHRDAIMNADMREVGIGILDEANSTTTVGPMVVTQHFAVDYAADAILTGVAFADANADNFYSPGEGLSEIDLIAVDTATGDRFVTSTWGSGGYTLELTPGIYDVIASGPAVGQVTFPAIAMNSQNIKLDITPASPPLPGDANMDGIVDRSDAALLAMNFGTPTGALWGKGDFDGSGSVGLLDLAILNRNLSLPTGNSASAASSAAVPEPTNFAFVMAAAITIFAPRIRSAQQKSPRRAG
jgi:uncharacterized protein YkwD